MQLPGRSFRAVPVGPEEATPEDLERGLEAMEDDEPAGEPEPATQPESEPTAGKPPVALLIHGGSWLHGHAPSMAIAVAIAKELGFKPVSVEYPLSDVVAANNTTRRIAKKWRDRGYPVVAFGESAGGQIATLLAVEGRVDYAVGNAPVSNLLRYWEGNEQEFWNKLGADEATRRELSPALHPQDRPVLLLHSPNDPGVPFDLSVDYARKFPGRVRLVRVHGCHILDCDGSRGFNYHRNTRIGLNWLARKEGLSPPG
jgi:acetyl esterase/lipase